MTPVFYLMIANLGHVLRANAIEEMKKCLLQCFKVVGENRCSHCRLAPSHV